MRCRLFLLIVGVVCLLAPAVPALAGGWALVRLDEDPVSPVLNEPWQVAFTVKQHDISPTSDVEPLLQAWHRETGQQIEAEAKHEGGVGRFTVEATFPRAGEWKWLIVPRGFPATSFAALTVLPSSDARPVEADQPAASGGEPDKEIVITDSGFFPTELTVAPGDTVRWRNESTTAHTVMGDDLAFDDSGVLDPGDEFSQTFDRAKIFRYWCGPHPYMVGQITVE